MMMMMMMLMLMTMFMVLMMLVMMMTAPPGVFWPLSEAALVVGQTLKKDDFDHKSYHDR